MAVVVPATAHPSHIELANKITTHNTNITNATNAGNTPLVFEFTKLKAKAQLDLVLSLISAGRILPANVLANETYTAGQDNGDAA
jgi:hypothetical protein